jgi:hypothetical protein
LLGVVNVLPGTAAALSEKSAARFRTTFSRVQQLDDLGSGKSASTFGHPNAHPISGGRKGNENRQTIR